MDWDGKLGGGGVATSGAYSLRVSADGTLGVTQVAQPLTVDLAAPKLTAPATASVTYRKTAKLAYTVRDAFSAAVKVSATVTNPKGDASRRWRSAGSSRAWLTPAPGSRGRAGPTR